MSDPIQRPEARAPRGFNDRRARDLAAERVILTRVSEVYERYGFEALDTGAFEYADALGKFLPDADRPNEGVFALQDDDEQWMALRYDLTAPWPGSPPRTGKPCPSPSAGTLLVRSGGMKSPVRADSGSSPNATLTRSARPALRPTPRSSPWRRKA